MTTNNTTSTVESPKTTFREVSKSDFEKLIAGRTNAGMVFDNSKRVINLVTLESLKEKEREKEAWHSIKTFFISSYVFWHEGRLYSYIKKRGALEGVFTADTPEDLMMGINRMYDNDPQEYVYSA